MAAIKSFDKKNLATLRTEINVALDKIGKAHGIAFQLGTISFLADSFHTQLKGVTGSVAGTTGQADGLTATWRADFLKNCARYGFQKSDLDRPFQYGRDMVTIAGMRTRARDKLVVKKPDGKYIAVSTDLVKRLIATAA